PILAFSYLSLHDALPISRHERVRRAGASAALDFGAGLEAQGAHAAGANHRSVADGARRARDPYAAAHPWARFVASARRHPTRCEDRKSTRLNSSHVKISY